MKIYKGFGMRKSVNFVSRSLSRIILVASLALASNAYASGHGGGSEGGGGGGGGAYESLAPFTVNLVGLQQMLQVTFTLKLAKTEAGEKVKMHMPAIRHKMILLMSVKTPEQILSSEGKLALIEEIKAAVNKVLDVNETEGVSDVLFNSIIVQ